MKSEIQYHKIQTKIHQLVTERLFHPSKGDDEIALLCEDFAGLWPGWVGRGEVETGVNAWLRRLELSHTGFWRGVGSGLPPYFAINATLKCSNGDNSFVFWNVLPGGLADKEGIAPGDTLIAVDGQESSGEPRFRLGGTYLLTVARGGRERQVRLMLPGRGPKDRPPMTQAKPLSYSAKGRTAVLKATSFPGAVGFDFMRGLQDAVAFFSDAGCDRLILDLRSNCGGGLASVRLMSLLTPDRRFIGYSLTRRGRSGRRTPAKLPAIRRLPGSKLALLPLALRFKIVNRDRSFRLFTEGLGSFPFQGRIAILVDEYTRSAAEMVAAFAKNERLARVIGTRTPGEVLGAANFHVGSDYRLRIPITAWFTATGELIERMGVEPDTESSNTLESLRSGRDIPMEIAENVLS